MRRLLFGNLVLLAVTITGPALTADLPIKSPAPFAERFSWSGCYAGAHAGGAFAQKDVTDPAQLVQDSFLFPGATTGLTTVNPSPSGAVIGGQIGCDYEFSSSVVIGVEGSASGSTMRGSRNAVLALGNPDIALVQANTDFLANLTGRIGYAFDNLLLYARGGAALAGDKFEVSGTFTGLPFDFRGLDNRFGWVAGGGVDVSLSRRWSAFLEYDYYGLGHGNVLMSDGINGFAGLVNVKQNVQVVKVGFNFHVFDGGW
ncbi:MAG: outer membrane beta-barrel protein [Bradyrhizobium sp.]|nr:outer membrane beta-barrel protein [Bradyrhizobium sp.]